MSPDDAPTLTASQVLGAATELLIAGGYNVVQAPPGAIGTLRVFEDAYGIVSLHIYDTWDQLARTWDVAQGELVDLISEHLTRSAPKAWEGYLALFSLSAPPASERIRVTELRYDTNRVRKLVSTGDELQTLGDVRTALLPLLPLDLEIRGPARAGVLDALADVIADEHISRTLIEGVIEAYLGNLSIVERLHELRVADQ
jgi:hypothetical protein